MVTPTPSVIPASTMSPSTNQAATCPPSAHCSRTSATSQWLSHTLHPLASPADAAAPSQRSNKTLTTALKLLLAKQRLTHPLPLAASTTAGTARRSNGRGHIHTVGDACFHHESLSKSDSTCPPSAPCSRRARRPYDSLTLLTHPSPLAASVTAGTVRGSSNHGHTYTFGNTCVHDESLNKIGQYMSAQCTLLPDKPDVPATLSHFAPSRESCGHRSTTSAFPTPRPLCTSCYLPNTHSHVPCLLQPHY